MSKDIWDRVAHSATIGLTTTAELYLLANTSAQTKLAGIPFGIWAGVINGINTNIVQVIHDYALPHLPLHERFSTAEGFLLNGASAFAIPPTLLYATGNISSGGDWAKVGAYTALGEFAGDYIYKNAVKDIIFGQPKSVNKRVMRKR